MPSIQHKRGLFQNAPVSGMLAGELYGTTDRGALFFATGPTTKVPVLPPIEALVDLVTVSPAADYLIIHDGDAVGVKEKRISFAEFRNALNIQGGDSDERVAVAAGGTAGYIWGTDGTNGIFRMNKSIRMTRAADSSYVTLEVDSVDCGTF